MAKRIYKITLSVSNFGGLYGEATALSERSYAEVLAMAQAELGDDTPADPCDVFDKLVELDTPFLIQGLDWNHQGWNEGTLISEEIVEEP